MMTQKNWPSIRDGGEERKRNIIANNSENYKFARKKLNEIDTKENRVRRIIEKTPTF